MELTIVRNRQDMEHLEDIIRRGQQTFYEVGRALMEIRDRGLYRDVKGYETFEAYCKKEWDFNRAHAYRLMDSAKVIEVLSPMGDITPSSERQTRPLARLEPEKQREVWQKAVETAPEGKVTAAHVYKIAREATYTGDNGGQSDCQGATEGTNRGRDRKLAVHYAEIAISQLERIRDDDPSRDEAFQRVEKWIHNRKNKNTKRK